MYGRVRNTGNSAEGGKGEDKKVREEKRDCRWKRDRDGYYVNDRETAEGDGRERRKGERDRYRREEREEK